MSADQMGLQAGKEMETPVTEQSEQMETPVPVPAEEESAKTLYMFSDMEGCQVLDRSGNPNSNSIAMCDPLFYSKLDEMMTKNSNMHVAFLGDYFDQGLQVIPSLQGMSMLYDKYGEGRVFIILGNRDINKLRFMYELTHTIAPPQLKEDGRNGQISIKVLLVKPAWTLCTICF